MSYSVVAKSLKELGKIEESCLSVVISRHSEQEIIQINTMIQALKGECKLEVVQDKEEELSDIKKVNKVQVFYMTFLPRQLNSLDEYERSDDMDSLDVDTGAYYEFRAQLAFTIGSLRATLQTITGYENKCQRMLLFLAVDRGNLYSAFSEYCHNNGKNIKDEFKNYGTAHSTASKYIQLYKLATAYPRMLVSNSTYNDWFIYGSLFEKYLIASPEMAVRFAEPLKEFEEEYQNAPTV